MKTISDNQVLDLQEAVAKLDRMIKVMRENNSILDDIVEVRSTLRVVVRHLGTVEKERT